MTVFYFLVLLLLLGLPGWEHNALIVRQPDEAACWAAQAEAVARFGAARVTGCIGVVEERGRG